MEQAIFSKSITSCLAMDAPQFTPLPCEASKNQILLELENITDFPFSTEPLNIHPVHRGINLESCK